MNCGFELRTSIPLFCNLKNILDLFFEAIQLWLNRFLPSECDHKILFFYRLVVTHLVHHLKVLDIAQLSHLPCLTWCSAPSDANSSKGSINWS